MQINAKSWFQIQLFAQDCVQDNNLIISLTNKYFLTDTFIDYFAASNKTL